MRPKNVTAVIFARLGPYHVARLRAAANAIPGELLSIEVAAESSEYQWDKVASEGFRRRTVILNRDYQTTSGRFRSKALVKVLEEEQPDSVAISGWGFAEDREAIRWCRARSKTSIIMSESQKHDSPRTWAKELYKSWLVGQCDAGLVGGQSHADYLVSLGMSAERIAFGYDVVDNNHFKSGAKLAREQGADERLRRALPKDYFLCSARFVGKKNLLGLLQAYWEYRQRIREQPWKLVLMGDGPLRLTIEARIRVLGLESDVLIPGFKQYEDLPAFYAFANAFVLPSRSEQWGLVVNEAMAAGVPVLVSSACGSSQLIEHGQNGWLFDPDKRQELTERLVEIHMAGPELVRIAAAGSATIEQWAPERFGSGLATALEVGSQYRINKKLYRTSR